MAVDELLEWSPGGANMRVVTGALWGGRIMELANPIKVGVLWRPVGGRGEPP